MTVAAVFTALGSVITMIWGVFGDCATTIMSNPLLFVPVLIALAGGVIFFCIGVVRRMGIRGVSSGGKKRYGR